MLDEEMDDIIRNAAAKHYPAYNDQAWEKMEMQLDKHLPQKKNRRKFIFFLLFFLLLGGGAFFALIHFAENNTSINKEIAENKGDKASVAEIPAPKTVPVNDNTEIPGATNTTKQTEANTGNDAVPVNDQIDNRGGTNTTKQIAGNPGNNTVNTFDNNVPKQKDNNKGVTGNSGKNKRSTGTTRGKLNMQIIAADLSDEAEKNNGQRPKNNVPATEKRVDKTNTAITTTNPENDEKENIITTPADLKKEKNTTGEEKKETVKTDTDIRKKEKDVAVTENKPLVSPEKKKQKKNAAGNFGITFSAGPDLSFVQLNKPGKTTLSYGAGLSYNFAKRITARAGFYFSKKIYSATADQYHTSGGVAYNYLDMVDASCKVYEIPVSLSYSFWQRKDHNWFGGIGLSSFLMKTESYDYQYKMPYGQTYNYKTEISNQNKHYFAVLTLSAGYQYQLSKRVSLQAEPYVKLPLAGIGLGKIKLNSSGILLTLTVKPFTKRK